MSVKYPFSVSGTTANLLFVNEMSCTAEEISEKRRIALERLTNRKLKINAAVQSTTTTTTVASESVQQNPTSNATATSPKSAVSFYGSDTNVKTNQLSAYENKIKNSPANKTNNRILSQPYPHHRNDNRSGPSASPITKLASVFTKVVSCSCSMVAPQRFQVISSSFSRQLVDIFRTIPSKIYDTNTQIWSFGVNDYELVMEKVNLLNPDVVIDGLPRFVLNIMRKGK